MKKLSSFVEKPVLDILPGKCCSQPDIRCSHIGKIGRQVYCENCGKAGEIRTTFTKACAEWKILF